MLDKNSTLIEDNFFINDKCKRSPCNSVAWDGDCDEGIFIDLNMTPRSIKKIIIAADVSKYTEDDKPLSLTSIFGISSIKDKKIAKNELQHSASIIMAVLERGFIGWHIQLPDFICHHSISALKGIFIEKHSHYRLANHHLKRSVSAKIQKPTKQSDLVELFPLMSQLDYENTIKEIYNKSSAKEYGHQFLLNAKELWGDAINSSHRKQAIETWIRDGADWGYSLEKEPSRTDNAEEKMVRLMKDARDYPHWTAHVLKHIDKQAILDYCTSDERADAVYNLFQEKSLIPHISPLKKRESLTADFDI